MGKYDDFTGNNIFYKDDKGNSIYVNGNSHYIVNEPEKQNKLKSIEGYRYFFYNGIKPPVLFASVILLGVPITFLLQYFYFPNIDERGAPFLIGFPIYLIFLWLYNNRIRSIVKNCELIFDRSVYEEIKKKEKNRKVKAPITRNIKSSLPDMNLFHIIVFLVIAAPFLYFVYTITMLEIEG